MTDTASIKRSREGAGRAVLHVLLVRTTRGSPCAVCCVPEDVCVLETFVILYTRNQHVSIMDFRGRTRLDPFFKSFFQVSPLVVEIITVKGYRLGEVGGQQRPSDALRYSYTFVVLLHGSQRAGYNVHRLLLQLGGSVDSEHMFQSVV